MGAKPSPGTSQAFKKLRSVVITTALIALGFLTLLHCHQAMKRALDVVTAFRYRMETELQGRKDSMYPAPVCCTGVDCLQMQNSAGRPQSRRAILTYLRDDMYLPLVQQVECTLRRVMPSMELAVMVIDGELSAHSMLVLQQLNITIIPVNPLNIQNYYESRFSKNWLKIRAWELDQYDAILLVDSDVAFAGDVQEVFDLPTPFAAVLDQPGLLHKEKIVVEIFQGGVFFIRPCPAVAKHMLDLVSNHPDLRFPYGNAEQEFVSWYFRYSAWLLPLEYNTMTRPSLVGNYTLGGRSPKILHYTSNKPFKGLDLKSPGHQYLCTNDELEARLRTNAFISV